MSGELVGWKLEYDEEGKLIVVPADNPFAGTVLRGPPPVSPSDGKEDPEWDRGFRAGLAR